MTWWRLVRKSKSKTKAKQILKQKLRTKFKKPKPPKPKKPIKIKKFELEERKKTAEDYLKKAKKLKKGIFIPDLAANLLGEKVKGKKARARLLDPKTIFTGIERRLIV